MQQYSEQDLKYAAELRKEIHREALAIVRKTLPDVSEVVDPHPVEDYFQENWEYPGKRYTVVAIPYGYGSRKAFVNSIVSNTLAEGVPKSERYADARSERNAESFDKSRQNPANQNDPFYLLLAGYPELVVEYHIVKDERYQGYVSHRKALKSAYGIFGSDFEGDPDQAAGKMISAEEMFSPQYQSGKLNYRKAFLDPPHKTGYSDKDFARVNSALFPNGTDKLEVYEWDTDWSDCFDDGHEWWGALCLTVYDKTLERFVVITASATD